MEDAHIESFNSILERVVNRFEFNTVEEAESKIDRFSEFYNNRKMYNAIGYITPKKMNKICVEKIQKD